MNILAIDPGNAQSAYAIIDQATREPLVFVKDSNDQVLREVSNYLTDGDPRNWTVAIELVGHYGTGMPAGQDVFDTCRWIGRFEQICHDHGAEPILIKRPTIKTHLCGSARAKDSNVIQALVDRFTPGQANHGKGTKAEPGWFHGFRADVWQSYALAVYVADTMSISQGGAA